MTVPISKEIVEAEMVWAAIEKEFEARVTKHALEQLKKALETEGCGGENEGSNAR